MKTRTILIISCFVLLAFFFICQIISNNEHRKAIDERQAFIKTVVKTMAGDDNIVDTREKAAFIRFLGYDNAIQDGQCISIECDGWENKFRISLGKEVVSTKSGEVVIPLLELGTVSREKLEEFMHSSEENSHNEIEVE